MTKPKNSFSHRRCSMTATVSRFLLLLPLSLLLAACGGGSGGDSDSNSSSSDTIVYSGSVSDGPVVDAQVIAVDANGRTLASVRSDAAAKYRIEVPANSAYPLIFRASGGTDLVSGGPPDFVLESAVADRSTTTVNLNPFSTLIVAGAKADPDGLGAASLATTRERLLAQLDFGISTGIADPIATPVTAANAATFVKSGEALAETLRRTQALLTAAGGTLDADGIIATLGADMSDGVIDGLGAGADTRVAAAVHAVAAEVVLETARNALVVGGAVATARLDEAIRLTSPDSTETSSDVRVSRESLAQARNALAALEGIAPTGLLARLEPLMSGPEEQLTPESLEAAVGGDTTEVLANALLLLSLADDAQLQQFNTQLREQILADDVSNGGNIDTAEPGLPAEEDDSGVPDSGTGSGESGPTEGSEGDQGATTPPSDTVPSDREPVVIRVNAGGPSYVDTTGITWSADTGFSAGSEAAKPDAVGGTTDPVLYQSERWDPNDETEMEYRFDVPNGLYVVRLHFSEHSRVAFTAGARIFDVEIEGVVRLEDLDVYAQAGANTALVKQVEVPVTDGQIAIRFLHQIQNPMVNAIEVLERRDFPITDLDASAAIQIDAVPVAVRIPLKAGETLAVSGDPAHGEALLIAPNTILYLPDGDFSGEDTLTYRVTNSAGNVSIANIRVEVRCSTCAEGPSLELSWEPNTDEVLGYRIYAGATAQTVARQVSEVRVGDEGFDPRTPAVSLTFQDLGLSLGESICFRVKAFNQAGESGFSESICSGA